MPGPQGNLCPSGPSSATVVGLRGLHTRQSVQVDWQLAQVNIARLQAPLDSQQLRGFVDALDPVNAAADAAPGFVWRLQTDDGNATAVRAFEWDAEESSGVIVNLSVWTDIEHLTTFVLSDEHRAILRQRREFFQRMPEAYLACWWVPAGHRPTTAEAEERIRYLRAHGPTPFAFTLRRHFASPAAAWLDQPARNDNERTPRS